MCDKLWSKPCDVGNDALGGPLPSYAYALQYLSSGTNMTYWHGRDIVLSASRRECCFARAALQHRGRGSTICYAQGLRLASPWPMVPGPNYIYKPRPMAASTLHHSSPRRKGQNEKKRKNMAAGCCNEYLKTTESYAETTDFRLHSAPRPPPFSSSSTRRPGHSGLGPRFLAPRSATLTPGHRGL